MIVTANYAHLDIIIQCSNYAQKKCITQRTIRVHIIISIDITNDKVQYACMMMKKQNVYRKWQKFFQSVAGNALQLTSNSESGSVTSLELNCTTKVSIAGSSWPSVLE